VPSGKTHQYPGSRTYRYRSVLRLALLLTATLGSWTAQAKDSPAADPYAESGLMAADQLSIRVKSDRLTLAITKTAQVYLSGVIDAGAPQRFEAWVKNGKVPFGSDIYLDASGADTGAALALGRLLRANSMVTHLGAPPQPGQKPRAAVCMDACMFVYLGALYRWSPTGTDRIGLRGPYLTGLRTQNAGQSAVSNDVAGYLTAMGIRAAGFVRMLASSNDTMIWLNYDQMLGWELANNGRLPLSASYQRKPGPATLTFTQVVRDGENRITLVCAPDGVTLTSRYGVGVARAQQFMARESRSYFEIDHQEVLPEQSGRARIVDDAIVFSRPLSLDQLATLLTTYSMGAWVKDKNGAVRYGFTIGPVTAKDSFPTFYADCEKIVPRSPAQAPGT
jgi:hypothetical protein